MFVARPILKKNANKNLLWATLPTHHVEKGSGNYWQSFLVLDLEIVISNQIAEQPMNVTCIRSARTWVGRASYASRTRRAVRILQIWRLKDKVLHPRKSPNITCCYILSKERSMFIITYTVDVDGTVIECVIGKVLMRQDVCGLKNVKLYLTPSSQRMASYSSKSWCMMLAV